MAVPMVLKNTNVKVATHQAPLTGENYDTEGEREKERARVALKLCSPYRQTYLGQVLRRSVTATALAGG